MGQAKAGTKKGTADGLASRCEPSARLGYYLLSQNIFASFCQLLQRCLRLRYWGTGLRSKALGNASLRHTDIAPGASRVPVRSRNAFASPSRRLSRMCIDLSLFIDYLMTYLELHDLS